MSAIEPLWYALTTKPRHEKAAALALGAKGVEAFLPLYRARHRWSDRVKNVQLPLFAGYVFGRFSNAERARILATPGVTSIVGFGNRPAPVSPQEIESIRAMVASGLPLGPWPFLKEGQRVRIEAGPLCGVEGVLLQIRDAWRVVVSVELLQRSVAAEVDGAVLSVIRPISGGSQKDAGRKGPGRSAHAGL